MARFGQALKPSKPPQQLSPNIPRPLKPSKPPQQLSKASEPHNPPQQQLCDGTSLGATFWAGLKTLKTSAAAFEGLRTSQPSAAAFGHGTSLGPTSCFYWASKLLRGTFWAGLKTLKTSAAAFEGLRTSQPSAAAFGHGTCFYWASKLPWRVLGKKPSKPPQQLSKASEPHNPPQQLSQASHLLWHGTSLLGFETATWHVFGKP